MDADSGVNAQELFLQEKSAKGGIVQRVRTQIGRRYKIQAYLRYEYDRIWPNPVEISTGIDPTGQTKNPRQVKFSSDLIKKNKWESDYWHKYEAIFTARSIYTSLWLQVTKSEKGIAWLYIDDVSVQLIK